LSFHFILMKRTMGSVIQQQLQHSFKKRLLVTLSPFSAMHPRPIRRRIFAEKLQPLGILPQFGGRNIPSFYEKMAARFRSVTFLHLCQHLGLIDLDYLERKLFDFLIWREPRCVICERFTFDMSGVYGAFVCAPCQNMLAEFTKHEELREVLVYMFAKEILPPHRVASIFEVLYEEDIARYIASRRKTTALYFTCADWVWKLLERWKMVEPKPEYILPFKDQIAWLERSERPMLPVEVAKTQKCSICGGKILSKKDVATCPTCLNEIRDKLRLYSPAETAS